MVCVFLSNNTWSCDIILKCIVSMQNRWKCIRKRAVRLTWETSLATWPGTLSCPVMVEKENIFLNPTFSSSALFFNPHFFPTKTLRVSLPFVCASFRSPPPQRRALQRQGAPFSAQSDRKRTGSRCTAGYAQSMCRPLGACCARLVVFQLYPNSTVSPPPHRSPSLSFAHSTILVLSVQTFTVVRLRAALFVQ